MRKLFVPLLFAALCTVTACEEGDSSLSIRNDSSFDLYEVNLSPVDSNSWGRNLLGLEPLGPGETLIVESIDCDDYDVRVEDEDAVECIIEDVTLCFDDAIWAITDLDLLLCAF